MRVLLMAMLLLGACAQPQTPTTTTAPAPNGGSGVAQLRADLAQVDRELRAPGIVVARVGETADLGNGLTVRPIAVKEDSRCPLNVTCVWAGRLVLTASVSGVERDLTLGETLSTPNGAVLLAVAAPPPWSEWPEAELPRPAYRFGFRRG